MASGLSGKKLPLIVIVGPTASGKTNLAIKLAKEFKGEIICADSRTIYRHMDIGTAKPTPQEQKKIPHWGIDLAEPGERFTASDFKTYAQKKIEEIRSRNHTPFLVGGTGLYVDGVIFDYQFSVDRDEAYRKELETKSLNQLYGICEKNNIKLPENSKNKRYVIRAIEQKSINTKRRNELIENCTVVGVTTSGEVLKQRIKNRTEQLFANSVVEEATILGKKYGWENEAMTGSIYRLAKLYLEGEFSLEEYKEKLTTLDWQLAKRQLTWFRRNPFIKWGTLTEVKSYLQTLLANK
jgi:tRNA dimethylallyltransferase